MSNPMTTDAAARLRAFVDRKWTNYNCLELNNDIRTLLDEREWRPIETAPKDGTSVLLVWHPPQPPGQGPVVVQASWMCCRHAHLAHRHDCPNEPDCDMRWDHYAGDMTHWLPLPSPPQPSRKDSHE